ncbi:MAG TPA: hypothetical protein VEK07_10955 [Polyangiaceae bacterium]|nr:hypothetical protein [Polyangiaceae bacterium]
MSPGRALEVWIDGIALPEDDARALWRRFSSWMDEHPADLAGFARSEGFASVHPELHAGSPALVASRSPATVQRPYGPAMESARARARAKRSAKAGSRRRR